MNILPAGIKYYSRERILLAGTKYNSQGPNITRGDHILLAGMKYYSRECINYSRGRKITCGNEILLAGIQYYSRKWIITRGKKYYSWERIITRGNLFITRGNDILLAGEKYWQYMAPEGFRIKAIVSCINRIHQLNYSRSDCSVWQSMISYPICTQSYTLTLGPRRCSCNLKLVIFKLISRIDILTFSYAIILRWMTQDLTDDQSTLIQVMAWCCQCHCLSQCWPGSMMSCGVSRPQWVNALKLKQDGHQFAEDIFKLIFFNWNFFILNLNKSLKYVSNRPLNN